ncbi:MAG: phosphonate C-P lyase system protein PhnL [Hyphomicrobiales bacterium]|nr:phosphonate C-P lyase system protein PhnL [Hyphomicrobiales bacterium]
MQAVLSLTGVSKSFTLHLQNGARLPVVSGVDLTVGEGQCVVLAGPSGSGKSSLLKMVYGNYRCAEGRIVLRDGDRIVDLAGASPRTMIDLRRHSIGYVSQFLRVIPRVATLDLIAEPVIAQGVEKGEALERARRLLHRLNLPERLWTLPPATFSGGEQQRVNIARGFAPDYSLLLLDEPTASLDAENRAAVVDLIREKKAQGVALLGIFHDESVRADIADRQIDIAAFAHGAA